jgi:hypothetical protein
MCAQIGGPGRVLNSRLVTSAEQRQLQTGIPGGLRAPRPGVSGICTSQRDTGHPPEDLFAAAAAEYDPDSGT